MFSRRAVGRQEARGRSAQPTIGFAAALISVIAACSISWYGSAAAKGRPKTAPASHPLTASQLAADLRAAAEITRVPANLAPPVSTATTADPTVVINGCEVLFDILMTSTPCVYGDRESRTSVVLFGDSHASAWFPALDWISKRERWRLVIFTKIGCSPPEVTVMHPAPYTECTIWRHNTEAQVAALHPALVIVSWARWIAGHATPEPGVPTPYASTWLNGVKATFDILRRSAKRVIFISDVPLLRIAAPDCVLQHLSDVSPCNHKRRGSSIYDPTLRSQEIKLARLERIDWIDPIPWFCSPIACPVVVGHFLLYRDNTHMTPPWSRFIAPVLRASLDSIMKPNPLTPRRGRS
jgi:hypothetical protein